MHWQQQWRPLPQYTGGIWKQSFISSVSLIVHTNQSPKMELLKSYVLQTRKYQIFILLWMESNLKTKLFKNEGVRIITWFLCPSFHQTQIQNNRWLLCFSIPPPWCGRKTFDAFSRLKTPFSVFSGLLWTGGKRNDISFAPWHVHPHWVRAYELILNFLFRVCQAPSMG